MLFEFFQGENSIDYGDWPLGLEDLELIGDHKFVIGVPFNSPPQLRRYLFAAAKTHFLRNKSIDHTLKAFGDSWEEIHSQPDARMIIVRQMTGSTKIVTRDALERVLHIPNKPDHLGLFVCGAALVRLQITFRAAIIAIHCGFHFEASSLARMILEQLAWIFSVHHLHDKSLFKVKPTKCITNLKRIYPYAGRLYDELSNIAHIAPQTTARYLQVGPDEISIRLASSEFAASDAFTLLILADIYAILTEIVYERFLRSFVYTKPKKNSNRLPMKSRPTQKLISKYRRAMASVGKQKRGK